MSHFAILVIGEDVEKQLQPYHEYECTGTKDEYVVFVDETEERTEEFTSGTRTMLINFDGELKDPWDDIFYRNPLPEEKDKVGMGSGCGNGLSWSSRDWNDGLGYRPKVKFIPDNYMEKEVPYKKIYDDVESFCRDWHSYDDENFQDGKIGSVTNPNSKWDWYQVGGRYAGRLFLKNNELTKKLAEFGAIDKPNFSYGWTEEQKKKMLSEPRCDSALKKNIDFTKMHQVPEKYDEAARFWEMKVEGAEPKTDEEKKEMKWDFYKTEYYTRRYGTKETYARCMSNFTMWGYLKDGDWFEKGGMGWFGMSGESDEDAVKFELEFFDRVIKPLPEDTLLTVVDCHI